MRSVPRSIYPTSTTSYTAIQNLQGRYYYYFKTVDFSGNLKIKRIISLCACNRENEWSGGERELFLVEGDSEEEEEEERSVVAAERRLRSSYDKPTTSLSHTHTHSLSTHELLLPPSLLLGGPTLFFMWPSIQH